MRRVLVIVIAGTAALAGTAAYVAHALHTPVAPPSGGVVISVAPGASFRSVAAQLRRAGILRHPYLLSAWARYWGDDRRVRSGDYRIGHPISPLQLLVFLRSARHALHWVTIPEGLTGGQIAEVFEREGFGGRDVFDCAMRDPATLLELELPASGVEGYLFPDTYAFEWARDPPAVISAMVRRFRRESTALAEPRMAAGLTETEMVILASVIEKETGLVHERALISGVFHNRLRRGMPLQSDPTVLYSLGMQRGNLTRADLAHPSPYNTYMHPGLPPGPIANPGRAALEAAIAPAQTTALYFVSRNDGSHEFSASLADHNRAVQRYQRTRGEDSAAMKATLEPPSP